jgi:hypothetical protein
MPVLKFTKNWNRKLDSDHYTAFRRRQKGYRKGEIYEVELKGAFHHRAACIEATYLTLAQVNDFISHLDAGVTAEAFKEIILTMYPDTAPNEVFILMLLKKIR